MLTLAGLGGEMMDCSALPSPQGTWSTWGGNLEPANSLCDPKWSKLSGRAPQKESSHFWPPHWECEQTSAKDSTLPALCFLCRLLSSLSPLTGMHTLWLRNTIKLNKKEKKLKQHASSFPARLTFPGSVLFEPFCHSEVILPTQVQHRTCPRTSGP